MKIMRVYIAGKIGEEVISDATRRKFDRAQRMLEERGYEVFNPTSERYQAALHRQYERDKNAETPWIEGTFPGFYGYALLRDLMILATKDAVYFLDDWDLSNGANVEHSFAMATGKRMLWQRRDDAVVFHAPGESEEDVWLPIEDRQ